MKKWTGERLETFVDAETTLEHLHRYAIALEFVVGMKVLDIACGEGYGSNLLANIAAEVVGVDVSKSTVQAADHKYKNDNLKFLVGSASDIPCQDNYFDIVVSYETIEHHDKHEEMLREIKRVLKPNGMLIMSSPDKRYYSDEKNFKNSFHVKELYEKEFKDLLGKYFTNTSFYFQRPTYASILIPEEAPASFKEYEGDFSAVRERIEFKQLYILGLASESSLPKLALSAFTDDQFLFRQVFTNNLKVRRTISYRLGDLLLSPFKYAGKILGK